MDKPAIREHTGIAGMQIDHLTAIVPDAHAAAAALTRLLGMEPVGSAALAGMQIFTFRLGNVEIHVNAPTAKGPVQAHLDQHGPSLHHVAFRVENLDATISDIAKIGFKTKGIPVETAPGLREVFVDPETTGGVLVQLVERTGNADVTPADLHDDAVGQLTGR